jgi:hypothetical protein
MVARELPRFVIAKPLKRGLSYYWNLPVHFRKLGCTIAQEHETSLGVDYVAAFGKDGKGGKAAILNGLFDEWNAKRKGEVQESAAPIARYGTVDWLFRIYKQSNDWRTQVSERTAPDHENTIHLLTDLPTKDGRRVGDLAVESISPRAADKLYFRVLEGPRGKRPRQAEKVVAIARHAWKVVRRLYPEVFSAGKDKAENPWVGVAKIKRKHAIKPHATREEVYEFAWAAVEAGWAEVGAAAVICFEWLQRPENVLAGYVSWTGYRSEKAPNAIRIIHHKTSKEVLHPLQDTDGTLFYPEAEAILAKVPRLGVPVVLRQYYDGSGKIDVWTAMRINKDRVRPLREKLGLPLFTLDACRHGGMTELEEAELTEGQGRALSGHATSAAYRRYAKATELRALGATRKRHAHRLMTASMEEKVAPKAER